MDTRIIAVGVLCLLIHNNSNLICRFTLTLFDLKITCN